MKRKIGVRRQASGTKKPKKPTDYPMAWDDAGVECKFPLASAAERLLWEVEARIDSRIVTTDENELNFLAKEPEIERVRQRLETSLESLGAALDRMVVAVAKGDSKAAKKAARKVTRARDIVDESAQRLDSLLCPLLYG